MRIYVHPNFTRNGIGTMLISRVEKYLKSKKANSYVIYPHSKNKIAVNFYEKMRFKRNPNLDRGYRSPCYEKEL